MATRASRRKVPGGTVDELIEALAGAQERILATAAQDTNQTVEVLRPAFDHLLMLVAGSEEPVTERETFREVGAQAARDGTDGGEILDRYLSLNWAAWQAAADVPGSERAAIVELGERLLKGIDRAIATMVEGYREIELGLAADRASRHRGLLEELLGSSFASPAVRARVRRRTRRHGIRPDGHFQLVTIALPGSSDTDIDRVVDRIEHGLRIPTPAASPPFTFRLPQVLEWHGLIVVLAGARWSGEPRLREILNTAVPGPWIAAQVGSIAGIETIPEAVAGADYAVTVAGRLGRTGWLGDPSVVALEAMFLLDKPLAEAAIKRELGPILADQRRGEELIETLHIYLDARHSVAETARRLGLAPRTVAYRLERIEALLGRSLSEDGGVRIGAALMALDVTRATSEE